MYLLALSFAAKTTLRMEEVAGALVAVGGALLFLSSMPFLRRTGSTLGGLAIAVGGVVFVLAVRYGLHP